MKAEILRLFKGFLGEKSDTINQTALAYGLIIPATASKDVVAEAIKQYGKDGVLWNQTFHKSFDKVANAPLMQLILEQIMHYFTTYGFETLGCYDESTVYIPAEKLEVPELKVESIKLTPINALTEDEVKTKLMTLITSGIALSDQTVKDIKVLSDFIDKDRFDEVANREVRTFLYDKYNIMPRNPEAFLRYLIFKATGATLKIQNVATYKSLQAADKALVLRMLEAYGDYAKLSSIFLRNKNLFLALKTKNVNSTEKVYEKVDKYHVKAIKTILKTSDEAAARVNTIINKLRKLAEANHKPLKKAVLDSLTSDTTISDEALVAALDKVTAFREVRLLNTLNYRLNGKDDIVYRVRNGKSYVNKIDSSIDSNVLAHYYDVIRKHLTAKLADKVNGKNIFVPTGIVYKAPTSEKQFVNNVPEGTYFELPVGKPLVFATHWTNLSEKDPNPGRNSFWGNEYSGKRVDLDMRMMNQTTNIGWNSNHRSGDREILFSGDITDAPAPKGATEAIYVGKDVRNQSFMITLNDFTQHSVEVPYEFIVAEASSITNKYVIDPNKIISKFNLKITPDKHQITLGQVKATETTKRFYFNDFAVGVSGAVSRQDKFTMGALSYMETYAELQTSLTDLLVEAGAKIVNTPTVKVQKAVLVTKPDGSQAAELQEVEVPVDIDLSIENIDKASIIELFIK